MSTSVIIPAAGSGERMGGAVSKQFIMLHGKAIIVHTLERFQACGAVGEIIIAAQQSAQEQLRFLIGEFHLTKVVRIVEGGKRRQDSVANALGVVDAKAEIVIVHDAVRPFIRQQTILESIEKARTYSAAVVAVPAKDTVKVANAKGRIEKTLDRSFLWMAQTPQAFRREILVEAYAKAAGEEIEATDDASLVERLNISPVIVEGSSDNIKITTQEDLDVASLIARRFKD